MTQIRKSWTKLWLTSEVGKTDKKIWPGQSIWEYKDLYIYIKIFFLQIKIWIFSLYFGILLNIISDHEKELYFIQCI